MTLRLSHHKVSQILSCYFRGIPQPEIARKVGVDQSTVSIYAARLRDRAAKVGWEAAGKEYEVFNEVDSLRSLAVELARDKLTVEEVKQGLHIMKLFMELGVSPEQHAALVRVCDEVADPGFIAAAVRLSQVEKEAGASYEQTVLRFEDLSHRLESLQGQVQSANEELQRVIQVLGAKKHEFNQLNRHLAQHRRGVKRKQAELDRELKKKVVQFGARAREIEQLAKLKAELRQTGMNVSTLVGLAKEFKT